MTNKEDILKAIKSTLKKNGVTQVDLAERIGVKQASVTQIINGNPSLQKLVEIANAVGCTVPELLSGGEYGSIPTKLTIVLNGQEMQYDQKK